MWEEKRAVEAAISGEIGGLGGDVTLGDLFTEGWMVEHTDATSIEAFVAASDYEVTDQESFEEVPEEAWDGHVDAHTEFDDWASMLSAAVEAYAVGDGADSDLEEVTEVDR
jgi:hypothetical protein